MKREIDLGFMTGFGESIDSGVGEGIGCEEIGSQEIGTGAGREEDWI